MKELLEYAVLFINITPYHLRETISENASEMKSSLEHQKLKVHWNFEE